MKCERCHQCESVASVTKVNDDGTAETVHLGNCDDCCRELRFLNLQSTTITTTSVSDLQEILSELIEKEASKAVGSSSKNIVVTGEMFGGANDSECLSCGLKFSAYKKTLMLGCQYCYDSFQDELEPRLKKYHRVSSHVSGATVTANQAFLLLHEIKDLQGQQAQAAEQEDFELAAELRDQIVTLQKKLDEMNQKAREK